MIFGHPSIVAWSFIFLSLVHPKFYGPSPHHGLVLHLGLSLYLWSIPNFMAHPPIMASSWSVPLSLVRPKFYGPSPHPPFDS